MEITQDPIYKDRLDPIALDEYLARQEQERKQAQEYFQGNPRACAQKLYDIAVQHTGGGRAASALLLSLWNDNFVCNMRDVICSLNIKNSEAASALLATLGPNHHLERYLTQDQIVRIIDVWGETHERRRA